MGQRLSDFRFTHRTDAHSCATAPDSHRSSLSISRALKNHLKTMSPQRAWDLQPDTFDFQRTPPLLSAAPGPCNQKIKFILFCRYLPPSLPPPLPKGSNGLVFCLEIAVCRQPFAVFSRPILHKVNMGRPAKRSYTAHSQWGPGSCSIGRPFVFVYLKKRRPGRDKIAKKQARKVPAQPDIFIRPGGKIFCRFFLFLFANDTERR